MEEMARRGSNFLGAAARTAERNALVLGFALALAVGLLAPAPGQQVAGAKWTATMLIVCIFVVSGLTLKTAEAKAALRAVWPTLYSIVSILALSPVLGMLVLRSGQAARGNIIPWGFWVGIAIFSAVPTTLSSGVTLVQNAGGSGALALLLVVVTNMLGVFTTPLWIQAYAKAGLLSTTSAGSSAPPNLDAASLLSKLALTILVPIVVAKLAREALAYFCQFDVGRFKRWLGHLSSLALVTIVWTNISLSADKLRAQSAESIGMLIALGVLFHLTLLALNALVVLPTMREVAPATALEDGEESATSEIQMESLNGHDNHHTLEMQKTGGGGADDGADDDEITPEPAAALGGSRTKRGRTWHRASHLLVAALV